MKGKGGEGGGGGRAVLGEWGGGLTDFTIK